MCEALPCHWYENPDHPGERFLVPCCPERIQDMEAACTCKLPVDELVRLRKEVARLRVEHARARLDYRDLSHAVGRHDDGEQIFAAAKRARAVFGGRP